MKKTPPVGNSPSAPPPTIDDTYPKLNAQNKKGVKKHDIPDESECQMCGRLFQALFIGKSDVCSDCYREYTDD